MSYTDSLLASGERMIRRSRQHWFVMVWNARWSIFAIAIALIGIVLRIVLDKSGGGPLLTALGYVVLFMFIFGLVWFAWGILKYRSQEFALTSRRVIQAEGVINKRATDSSLEKINDAILTESIFGRIFGFGDLEVLTASEAGIDRLRMLRDAKDFKKAMLEAKHELELELTRPIMAPLRVPDAGMGSAQAAPPPPAAPPPLAPPPAPVAPPAAPVAPRPPVAPAPVSPADVTASLDRLGNLRDQGLITPAEFEAKKQELLDRL